MIGRVNTFQGTPASLHLNQSKRNQFFLHVRPRLTSQQPSRRSGAALFPFSRIKRMQISLGQLDTAARPYVRWTGFHRRLLGFHTPEENTGGVEARRTHARTLASITGTNMAIPMRGGGSPVEAVRPTEPQRPASRLKGSPPNQDGREDVNCAESGSATRRRPLASRTAAAAAALNTAADKDNVIPLCTEPKEEIG